MEVKIRQTVVIIVLGMRCKVTKYKLERLYLTFIFSSAKIEMSKATLSLNADQHLGYSISTYLSS